MAYLVLNGLPLEIQSNSAPRSRERIGETQRTFGGTLKSTVRAIKRTWGPYDTPPLTVAEAEAVVGAVGLGMIPVQGDAIGTTLDADVEITGERDQKDASQAGDFRRILTLVIREV